MSKYLIVFLLMMSCCFAVNAENRESISPQNGLQEQYINSAVAFEKIQKMARERGMTDEQFIVLLNEIVMRLQNGYSLDSLMVVDKNEQNIAAILMIVCGVAIIGLTVAWINLKMKLDQRFIFEPGTDISISGGRVEFCGDMILHPNARFDLVRGAMIVE